MEIVRANNHEGPLSVASTNLNERPKKQSHFIEANTLEGDLNEMRQRHIIPVYHKDNEPLISHTDFIETVQEVVDEHFRPETILEPVIRLSHPVKGRVPEARNKPANELNEWEKTLYFERMAFLIEIPSISETIDGQQLSLTIGGIKAYNLDNLQGKKGADEHFKLFCGFQVKVCTNLCVWSDGVVQDARVKDLNQLLSSVDDLVSRFDAITQLKRMEELQEAVLSEHQFAQLIGRCKLYQHMPNQDKRKLPEFTFGEQHLSNICRDYYTDENFGRAEDGSINMWKVYNLFTSAARSSYIDTFLERSVNASKFTASLSNAIRQGQEHWFVS